MEDQQKPVVPEVKISSKFNRKSVLAETAIGFLIIGIVLGFLATRNVNNSGPNTAFVYVTPTPDTRLLEDPSEILKNKVFGEWYGGLEAKVISKTDRSFVVEANGQRLEIFMQDSITRLADETNPSKPVIITLAQLPVGSTVRGSVTISRGTLTGNMNQHVIANGISIISK